MNTLSTVSAPMATPIDEACRLSGLSRSAIYLGLSKGSIRAVKHGNRTLILTESLREYLAALPPATFRAPKGAKAARAA